MTATDERQTRHGSLLVLLSRAQRGVLTTAEASLLRAHVEVELAEADADDAQPECGAPNWSALADTVRALRERAEQKLSGSESLGHTLLQRAEAALACVRDLAHRMSAGSPLGAAAVYAERIEQAPGDQEQPAAL